MRLFASIHLCHHPHLEALAFLSHRSEQSQQSSTLKVYKWKKFKTSIVRSTALRNSYLFNQGNVQFSLQLLPFKTFDFVQCQVTAWRSFAEFQPPWISRGTWKIDQCRKWAGGGVQVPYAIIRTWPNLKTFGTDIKPKDTKQTVFRRTNNLNAC
jgi:hypothetical protein